MNINNMDNIKNNDKTAYLYSDGRYTKFKYGDCILTIIAPYSLERYIKVLKWDAGYIEVLAKYSHNSEPEEEYIDLVPTLKNLCMEPDAFIKDIDRVEVRYE